MQAFLYAALVILFTTSVVFRRKYKKAKKFRTLLYKRFFLPQISLEAVSPLFATNQFGPTLAAEVHFMGHGDLKVPGGTSDTEAWILAVLAKNAKAMFELGTCTGKTAYLLARNGGPDAAVTTLTLPPEQMAEYERSNQDDRIATDNALVESSFTHFFYSGTAVESKITQLFCDSKKFDETPYLGRFDLIFIDGSHAYSYVKSDSEKCMRMLAPNGIIIWHDYCGISEGSQDVYKYLNALSQEHSLHHIKETTMVMYRKA